MWLRVVMYREMERFLRDLPCRDLDALEISGRFGERFGFRTYRSVAHPDYDLCRGPLAGAWDIVIADQVLEHVSNPAVAVRNVASMLKPGGIFILTTPFLVKIHREPLDCHRWSDTGLRLLLGSNGFEAEATEIGMWGNRACVIANFKQWRRYNPIFHSLSNEPEFPIVVWAFARRSATGHSLG